MTAVLVAVVSKRPQKVAVAAAVLAQLEVTLQAQALLVMGATVSLAASLVHRLPALVVVVVVHRLLLVLVVRVAAVQVRHQALAPTAAQTQVAVVAELRPPDQTAATAVLVS